MDLALLADQLAATGDPNRAGTMRGSRDLGRARAALRMAHREIEKCFTELSILTEEVPY